MDKKRLNLYRNKEWYAFRDAVIQNDDCKCVRCGRTQAETTLQVHHKAYLPNKKPWEYGMELCETLCKRCHAEEHGEIMPKTGWELVGENDLGDLVGTCEYCGNNLRYEFEIVHEKWGSMIVGTHCCDNLTDSEIASTRVKSLKRYESRKKTFLKSSRWKVTGNTYQIRHGIFPAKIMPEADGWVLIIDNKRGKTYPSLKAAQEKLFDVIERGELVKYYERNNLVLPSVKLPKGKRKTGTQNDNL